MTEQTNLNNETFEVTFTLRQEGMDGDVSAYLDFSHPPTKFLGDTAPPEAFERMVTMVQWYLYEAGFIDENGELVEQGTDDFVLTARKLN